MILIYDIAHLMFAVLYRLLLSFRVIGSENVPKTGPVILASNHASYLDPTLVGTGIWRRVRFVAKEELFDRAWKRFILFHGWKAIPIRREKLDKAVLKNIMDVLKSGDVVGLFPEGTRGMGDKLLPGKAGIGMIVSMAGVPVVPVYIKGSDKTLSKTHEKLNLVPITIAYGKPIEFTRVPGEAGHERYQRVSDTVMAEIEKLKLMVG